MFHTLKAVKISIKINKYIPWIGFPPSSVGAFHFNVTEDLSNLVISRSRGSLGASTYQRSHVSKRMLMIERVTKILCFYVIYNNGVLLIVHWTNSFANARETELTTKLTDMAVVEAI